MKVKKGMVAALALSALPYDGAVCGRIVVGPEAVILNLAKAGLVDTADAAVDSASVHGDPVIIGIDAAEFAALMAEPDVVTEPDPAPDGGGTRSDQQQEGA